jgi:hypothetical protein
MGKPWSPPCTLHDPEVDFHTSTPSIVLHEGELLTNVRYVNYHIDDRGGYVQKDTIETRNILYQGANKPRVLQYNKLLDNTYVGLEDVRIFSYNRQLYYNANRGLGYSTFVIEHGIIDTDTGAIRSSILLNCSFQNQIEKNWVLLEDGKGEMKCVYHWYPLTIGDINAETGLYTVTHKIHTPRCFKHFRGSTNGVRVGDEVWFVCHVVSYEDRRYYYHVIVALDINTLEVRRFTQFFTFEGEKVEYTLGFIYMEKENLFRIGYSTMDRITKFIEITHAEINKLF